MFHLLFFCSYSYLDARLQCKKICHLYLMAPCFQPLESQVQFCCSRTISAQATGFCSVLVLRCWNERLLSLKCRQNFVKINALVSFNALSCLSVSLPLSTSASRLLSNRQQNTHSLYMRVS